MEFWLELDNSCSTADDQRRKFVLDTLFVVEYLNQYFKRVKFSGTKQIRIQLTNDATISERIEKPFPSFPVCRVVMKYDVLSFINLDFTDKKKELVNILLTGSLRAAEAMGWVRDGFLDAYNEIVATKYEFIQTVNRKQKNSSKKQTAQILREIIPGAIVYKLALTDSKSRESNEISIATFFADRAFDIPGFNKLIDSGKWLDDVIYEIHNDSNEIIHSIDSATLLCSVHFEPTGGTSLEYIRDKYEYAGTNDATRAQEIKKRWF